MKFSLTLAILCFALALGCSNEQTKTDEASDSPASPETVKENDQSGEQSLDTPEKAFAAFAQSMEKEDWQSAVTMVTDETKQMLVMGMVMQASFMTMEDEAQAKELEQLFNKHGINEDMAAGPGGEDVDINKLVPDLPAFVGELAAWIKANADDSEKGFPKLTKVSDVKIEGDTATGMAETERGPQPIEFRQEAGGWKVHLATGPPPEPTIEDLGVDFTDLGEGTLGSMQLNDKSSGLNHAFAYRGKFFDEPCINLVLSAEEVSEEKQEELKKDLEEGDGDAMFFAEGPNVSLKLTPDGELMSMFAWIDNSSISSNRGPAVEVQIDGDMVSGKVAKLPDDRGEEQLQFKAQFDTEIQF